MSQEQTAGSLGRLGRDLADLLPAESADTRQVLAVAEEAGEFVGAYRRWAGLARRDGSWDDVEAELADVVIAAYVTAAVLGVDLDAAVRAKAVVVASRAMERTESGQPPRPVRKPPTTTACTATVPDLRCPVAGCDGAVRSAVDWSTEEFDGPACSTDPDRHRWDTDGHPLPPMHATCRSCGGLTYWSTISDRYRCSYCEDMA